MRILGIETSCDETAAAVVEDGKRLLSNAVLSSMDLHAAYGGVVPEIAARSHIEAITPVIEQALYVAKYGQSNGSDGVQGAGEQRNESYKKYDERAAQPATQQSAENTSAKTGFARLSRSETDALWDDIDAIAVTYGAGLGGSLLVGVMTARTLAITKNKPLYAVNHVEGHIYANFLTETTLPDYVLPTAAPQFPLLGLIVSGGHSQIVIWQNHFQYTLLGQTHDDAIGEAFDKVAKIIGLPYPGGPSVSKKALEGNPQAFEFPKSRMQNKYDYSFSGIKTAVLRTAQSLVGADHTLSSLELPGLLSDAQKADIAASFQRVAVETVVDKVITAYQEFQPRSVVIGGGVAASPELRRQLAERLPIEIQYTDPKLCTDNGAMIATLGYYHAAHQRPTADPYSLAIAPGLSM